MKNLYLLVIFLLLSSCFGNPLPSIDDDDASINLEPVLPVLTSSIEQVHSENGEYVITGHIESLGRKPILEYGHTWSLEKKPASSNNSTQLGTRTGTGTFTSRILLEDEQQQYYCRAYAITVVGTVFGESVLLNP